MITIKRNDTARKITSTLKYTTGEVVDLTSAQAVNLRMVPDGSTDRKLDVAVTMLAPLTGGNVEYKLTAANYAALGVGMFRGEWEVVYTNGEHLHAPSMGYDEIEILADL